MAFEFKLPDIGEGVVEGEITKWLVKPGDPIAVDQPMVEVMTDKATVVIPSPRAGIVVETRGKEGEIAKVHSVLVVIDEKGAAGAQPSAPSAQPAPKAASAPATAGAAKAPAPKSPPPAARSASPSPAQAAAPKAESRPPPQAQSAPRAPLPRAANGRSGNGEAAEAHAQEEQAKVLAAPATRRLARELGVDLTAVRGTGPAGRVTSADVRGATSPEGVQAPGTRDAEEAPVAGDDGHEARDQTEAPRAAEGDERIPIRGLRRRIWDKMAESTAHAAPFTFVEECDVTELVGFRERFNKHLKEGAAQITYLPFIVKAVLVALKRFPDMNAHVDDAAMEYVRRKDYHIGVAVASDRGLIVPVVRHADRRSMVDLAQEIKRLADATRSGQLRPADLGGSTFTITSLGKDGGIFATPIINYPEVAIMGVHKISKRPMVIDDQVVIRDVMNLSLSFDHRLIDGHVGAAFTYEVIRLLEIPERLMMEMS